MTNILMDNKANSTIARVPLINTERSIFPVEFSRKQTMKASFLYPIFCEETIPSDTWDISLTHFTRILPQLTAPIDNLWLRMFFFYVPSRLLWENFTKQHGERDNPEDTIDYLTPTITSTLGFKAKSIYDYMGGIRMGQKGTKISALPLRAYNLIWNTYFRASEIQDEVTFNKTDTDDNESDYKLLKINKFHDYFTDTLPNLLAGGQDITLPLGTSAPVVGNGMPLGLQAYNNANPSEIKNYGLMHYNLGAQFSTNGYGSPLSSTELTGQNNIGNQYGIGVNQNPAYSGLIADISNATASTISALRLAIQTQELLERDNRSGNRYVDQMYGRYKTVLPDLMIYRPQLIGSMSTPLFTSPVIQNSGTGTTGQNTPQGNIAGMGVCTNTGNIITTSVGEFGYIIGLATIQAVPQYQQGLDKKWTRYERYDYYYPEFEGLSDQAVKNSEIFLQDDDVIDADGNIVNDLTFGYIGRYDELRYFKNQICGELRSDYTLTMDSWHYGEKFENLPTLSGDFLEDKTDEIIKRTMAIQTEGEGDNEETAEQFIIDIEYRGAVARELTTSAVPQTGGSLL